MLLCQIFQATVLCNEVTQTVRFLNPLSSLNLADIHVRSLMQIGQQASLARTLDSLAVDVWCVSETRIQDASTVFQINAPNLSTKYFLRTSGDDHSKAAGLYGVGIVLNQRLEAALLDWILWKAVCVLRLEGAIHKNRQRKTQGCLFVISAYGPTDSSSDNLKYMSYDQLTALINQSRNSDIMILAGDLNAQVGKPFHLNIAYGVASYCLHKEQIMKSDSFTSVQLTVGSYPVLIFNAIRRTATWHSRGYMRWSQIDHIAVSFRWRGCVQICSSYWNSYVDSDHALLLSLQITVFWTTSVTQYTTGDWSA